MSLFPAPNREPLENLYHTLLNTFYPYRLHRLYIRGEGSPISTLNDDTLLNIFYLYRLHCLYIRDEDEDILLGFIRMWKLAKVSRRWRGIILAFPSLLDLHLVCTFMVPVADTLARYPPFPLAIFYNESLHEMTKKEEEGALVALSHRPRVHCISLTMPRHKLEKFTIAMDDQFPALKRLDINSSIPEEPRLMLSQTFDAPNLRHIYLRRVTLPLQCPLLTAAAGLVFLRLEDIPRSSYFTPSYLLTQLSFMPQLETLMIGFYYSNQEIVDTPTVMHVTLFNLRVLTFRGFESYLEGLLSRISAPSLSIFHVQYFSQLTFGVPRLLPFMQTSNNLKFHTVKLTFSRDSFHLESESDPLLGKWNHVLEVRIRCRPFDWQVGSAMQILSTLSPILSVVVEKVALTVIHDLSSGWHDSIDGTEWRELFRPFNNAKALKVRVGANTEAISDQSLCIEDGELPLELLPNLEELSSSQSCVNMFTQFIDERKAVGHPVRLVRNLDDFQSGTRITHTLAMPSSSNSPKQVCDNYSFQM
jgi:hypothetical protein